MTLTKLLIAIAISSLHTPLFAHQPVMDMAPRWNSGYGIQTRYEITEKTKQYHQSSEIENPYSLFSKSSTLWIEGVYSFTREHRVSFKLPYHSKMAQQLTDGQPQQISASGLGDLIIGFLNKWYINKPGLTGNLSMTPSLKLPTGALHNTLSLGTGTYDIGLSLSGSIESYLVYGLIDIFTWHHSTQTTGLKKGALYGMDMDLGLHPYHDNSQNMGVFVLLGINGRYHRHDTLNDVLSSNTGGTLLEAVPTLVLYRDNLMLRCQYHVPVFSHLNGVQLAPTSGFQLGIGIVY